MDNINKALDILTISGQARTAFPYYHATIVNAVRRNPTEKGREMLYTLELYMTMDGASETFYEREYHAYLESMDWRNRARQCKEAAGNRCQLCNSDGNLQAHHRTYDRIYSELPADLIALCDDCHGKQHRVNA